MRTICSAISNSAGWNAAILLITVKKQRYSDNSISRSEWNDVCKWKTLPQHLGKWHGVRCREATYYSTRNMWMRGWAWYCGTTVCLVYVTHRISTHGSPPDQGAAAAAPAARPLEASKEEAARAAGPPQGRWSAASGAAAGGEGGGALAPLSFLTWFRLCKRSFLLVFFYEILGSKNMLLYYFLPAIVKHKKMCLLYLCYSF